MNTESDVIVFLETSGENMGPVNRGLLAEGRRIARLLDVSLGAIVVGVPVDDRRFLEEYGVSSLYHVEGKDLSSYSCEVFAWAAQEALTLNRVSFRPLLFAHSDRGSEVAPRIASLLGTSAVALCSDIRVRGKTLSYVKSVEGGQFEQEISYAGPFPEIVTIATEALGSGEGATAGGGDARASTPLRIVDVSVTVPADLVRTRSLQLIPPDFKTVDIVHARRIVGIGSGCADLSRSEELSHLLGASLATTRPVVDEGRIPKKRMIGQTGKTVSPELYLALGISGSPHHVAGIQRSGAILSVNRDPRAPIFNFSDVGFVADLEGLLPRLIDRIKRYRDEGPP